MVRAAACLVGAIAGFLVFPAHAENACRNNRDLQAGRLYVVIGKQLTEVGASTQMPVPETGISLIYAAANPAGGVVAIKQLNQAARDPGEDGDVQRVVVNRPAVHEPCRNGVRRKPLESSVSAREYSGYHSAREQRSDRLDLFHFAYRTEGATRCRATNEGTVAGRSHYLFTEPEAGERYRTAQVGPGGGSAAVSAVIAAVRGFFTVPPVLAAPTAGAAGGTKRYTYLRTMLRRYDASAVGPSCVSFRIRPAPGDRATYLSIVDLNDVDTFGPAPSQATWKVLWSAGQ